MNKHFKVDLSNPNFDEIPVEVTMGILRACSAMFTEQRELENNKKEEISQSIITTSTTTTFAEK